MKFDFILTDCAWAYDNNQSNDSDRGGKPYSEMKMEDLYNLNLSEIANPNSLLFSWSTFPKLKEGIEFIERNGFEYKTIGFAWVKINKNGKIIYINNGKKQQDIYIKGGLFSGIGYYTASNLEVCLIGKKGKGLQRTNKDVKQLIFSQLTEHSAKPQEQYGRIRRLYGDEISKVELFARKDKKFENGYINVGNEVQETLGLDIREALESIKQDKYL